MSRDDGPTNYWWREVRLDLLHILIAGLLHRIVPREVERFLEVVRLDIIRARSFLGRCEIS